ncbi:MAG: hypothetical protein MUD16_11250 [Desulfobacterales bacterium]|nr:hypothetical protein [Desulfobacterales bacterium]
MHAIGSIAGRLLTLLVLVGALAAPGWSLSAKDAVRLKKAGVSAATLEVIAREKVIETAAFSADEIVAMKSAGIGEEALQAILSAGSFLKEREPVVYGRELRPIRFTTAQDIIALKEAGVSDAVIEAVVAVSRRDADADRDGAYRLLRDMGLSVDVIRP